MFEKISLEEFSNRYKKHLLWLADKKGGERFVLHQRDFSYLNLSHLNLSLALLSENCFRGVNFQETNLQGADLSGSTMYGTDMRNTRLYGANLSGIDFLGTDFRYADLSFADVTNSKFRVTDTDYATIDNTLVNVFTTGYPLSCPEKGQFTAFKHAQGYILELEVPAEALRSSALGRICRVSKAKLLSITKKDGTPTELQEIVSDYDPSFIYKLGQYSEVLNFDTNRWNECGAGIHCYITRDEAIYG